MIPTIKIEDYNYDLPDNKIARYPLNSRDASKLLIFEHNSINESVFSNLQEFIPSDSLLIFNNTKVVPARLIFRKDTGAIIEIFTLEPFSPADYNISFSSTRSNRWRAVIGNAKKWKQGELYPLLGSESEDIYSLRAKMIAKEEDSYIVEFTWQGEVTFATILDYYGNIPIPPYLQRDSEKIDEERYQTLYAKYRGSVAAPTAGLHFTDSVLNGLKNKGVKTGDVCLHVGAGTFIPVKSELVSDHKMHSEPFSISKAFLELIYDNIQSNKIIAVGTTSVRTLESLYFVGLHCIKEGRLTDNSTYVSQWEPYTISSGRGISYKESIEAILESIDKEGVNSLEARTGIIIVPSYSFKAVDAMITNFHQPKSTLLLLISAFIGEGWREAYKYAMERDFRFLSYGDSSLLWRR